MESEATIRRQGNSVGIPLMGSGTRTLGAAIVSQARFLDYGARRAKFVEAGPPEVIADAMARLQAALDSEPA